MNALVSELVKVLRNLMSSNRVINKINLKEYEEIITITFSLFFITAYL